MTASDPLLEPPGSAPFDQAARLGRRRFIVGAGAVAAASALGTVGLPDIARAALPSGASNFHILAKPYRAADTRFPADFDYTVVNSRQIRIAIAGVAHPDSTAANPIDGVPADATAVVLNVTGIRNGGTNNVRVFPTGLRLPGVSNVNVAPFATSANMATVKLGNRSVDVAVELPADVIVDVLGYYRPVGGAVAEGRYVSLPLPVRAFDRAVGANRYTTVDLTDVDGLNGASSVVINLTAVQVSGIGYYSALPHDATGLPSTSNLNVASTGETRAGAAVVPIETVGGKRLIKVYSVPSAVRLIVDVFGYYTRSSSGASTNGLFVPLDPVRIRDTRHDVVAPTNGLTPPRPDEPVGRLWPNWFVETRLPDDVRTRAAAVVMNVTAVRPRSHRGHIRVSAARGPLPSTSNLNWVGPYAVPNHVISAVSPSGVQAFTPNGCHVLFDLAGYFLGGAADGLWPATNPLPPATAPEWTLTVPRLGLVSSVRSGPTWLTDLGHSWHWTGTGYMGQDLHVSVFGHRTDAGGPYRNVHWLQPGDIATVRTGDGREFTYRYVRVDIVLGVEGSRDPGTEKVLAATRLHPGPTLSMISCTEPNGLPTDVDHRRIDTFELVSWREL